MSRSKAAALVMAAGAGERLGSRTPKQYLPLAGGPNALRRAI
ncbi:MAG: hypothetical protein HOJ21_00060, partial [Alphaproteobacteria bacterium]|nr:hypothetical protein [Alphaproteobacteria bacterium]